MKSVNNRIEADQHRVTNGNTASVTINYVGSSDLNWYLPTSNGTNGYVLTTNGAGVLSWGPGGSGSSGTGSGSLSSSSIQQTTGFAGLYAGTDGVIQSDHYRIQGSITGANSVIATQSGQTKVVQGMSFSVVANQSYNFDLKLAYSQIAATTSPQFGMSWSGAGTMSAVAWGISTAGTATFSMMTASGNVLTLSGTQPYPTMNMVRIEGTYLPSSNGVVQMTFASRTGGTVSILYANSSGIINTVS